LPNNIIILNAFIARNQLGSSLCDRLGCAKVSLHILQDVNYCLLKHNVRITGG